MTDCEYCKGKPGISLTTVNLGGRWVHYGYTNYYPCSKESLVADPGKILKIRKKAESGDVAGADVLWLINHFGAALPRYTEHTWQEFIGTEEKSNG